MPPNHDRPAQQKPTLAIVASSAPPLGAGGIASAHYNLFRLLQREGYNVRLVTYGDPGRHREAEGIVRFGTPPGMSRLIHFAVACYLRLRGSCKMAYQLADIMVSAPGAAQVGRYLKRSAPDIVILPDHDAPGLFIGHHGWKTFLVSHHNPSRFVGNPALGDFCPIDARLAIKLENRVLAKVDGVLCPSAYMREKFVETYQYSGPLAVVPNLLDEKALEAIAPFDLHGALGLPDCAPIIYIPSAGSPFKGKAHVATLVRDLCSRCAGPIGFYLSGAVPAALRQELSSVPDNARLHIPGHLGYADNLARVKACSFGLSPTLLESFGMAILEANHCGLPMVAFDAGAVSEVVNHGVNGYLAPYLDLDTLLDQASRLLENDHLSAMRQSTRSYVATMPSARETLQQLLDFMASV